MFCIYCSCSCLCFALECSCIIISSQIYIKWLLAVLYHLRNPRSDTTVLHMGVRCYVRVLRCYIRCYIGAIYGCLVLYKGAS